MLRYMKLALILLGWLLLSSADVEISINGEPAENHFAKEFDESRSRDVTVVNYLDIACEIRWLKSDDEITSSIFIAKLPPLGSTTMTSFPTHRFIVTREDLPLSQQEPLSEFYIVHTVAKYKVGRVRPQDVPLSSILVPLNQGKTTHMSAKFKSVYPYKLTRYWDDGGDGVYQGTLNMGQENTIASYEGHVFFFTLADNRSHEVARFTMHPDQYMYVVYPDTEAQRKLVPVELFDDLSKQLAFMEEYRNRTGMHWRHYFGDGAPRPAPSLHMWTAEHIGQTHQVVSKEGFWKCKGSTEHCQSKTEVSLNLTVISQAPRAFHIPNFLSDFECDSIIHYAADKVKLSSVGNYDTGAFTTNTRTSRNTWIGRKAMDITETLYRRAANVLNISEAILHPHLNVEEMQVVHYINGQKYDAHHDWGSHGTSQSRLITLLLYLTDQEKPNAGGETSFPKADGGRGIKVRPVKGNAMLFYDLLEDGNGDDLSLHAALPVHEGQKWLANFWVWDPHR